MTLRGGRAGTVLARPSLASVLVGALLLLGASQDARAAVFSVRCTVNGENFSPDGSVTRMQPDTRTYIVDTDRGTFWDLPARITAAQVAFAGTLASGAAVTGTLDRASGQLSMPLRTRAGYRSLNVGSCQPASP